MIVVVVIVVVGVCGVLWGLRSSRRWKDFKIIVKRFGILPAYLRIKGLRGNEVWERALSSYPDNPFIWRLTFSQVDDWCEELCREVVNGLEPGRPLGVMVEDPILGVITMITGLKTNTPLVLYHLAAQGQLLTHQLKEVPQVNYILASTNRVPQIQEADGAWEIANNLWDKSLRFRSLCVLRRKKLEETPEEPDYLTKYAGVYIFFFTSGTTGLSKATMVSVTKFTLMGPVFAREVAVTSRDVIMTISPVTRMIWQITTALYTGCCIQPNNNMDTVPKEITATILYSGYQMTLDLVESLEAKKHKFKNLRLHLVLGFPSDTAARLFVLYPSIHLMNYYGSCEGVLGLFNHDVIEACGYRVGHFITSPIQLLTLDEKEEPIRDNKTGLCIPSNMGLLVKRRNRLTSFNRYVNIPESECLIQDVLQKGDVFELTGDVMRDGGDGNLYFVKRAGDNFRFKNMNCSCEHLENLLNQVTAVRCCAVYAIPHHKYNNRVGMGALQLKQKPPTTPNLLISIYSHLDKHSDTKPLFLKIVDYFTTLETGKIDKQKLRKEGYECEDVWILSDEKRTYVPFRAAALAAALAGDEVTGSEASGSDRGTDDEN